MEKNKASKKKENKRKKSQRKKMNASNIKRQKSKQTKEEELLIKNLALILERNIFICYINEKAKIQRK